MFQTTNQIFMQKPKYIAKTKSRPQSIPSTIRSAIGSTDGVQRHVYDHMAIQVKSTVTLRRGRNFSSTTALTAPTKTQSGRAVACCPPKSNNGHFSVTHQSRSSLSVWLVVSISLKNMSSSVGMIIPKYSQYMDK